MSLPHEMRATRPAPLPLRAPGSLGPRKKSKQPTPFDPDELSRKLYVVLAEREAYSERKRRAWAESERQARSSVFVQPRTNRGPERAKPSSESPRRHPPAGASRPYNQERTNAGHHNTASASEAWRDDHATSNYRRAPQGPGSHFTHATMAGRAEDKALAHSSSQRVMELNMQGPPNSDYNVGEHNRTNSQRELIAETTTAEPDEREQLRLAQRHTFETHFRTRSDNQNDDDHARAKRTALLRSKTALDTPGGSVLHLERQDSCDPSAVARGHRADWTQNNGNKDQTDDSARSPLRKADSKWTLKGRLGVSQRSKETVETPPEMVNSPPETLKSPKSFKSLKSPKSGFFARFKR